MFLQTLPAPYCSLVLVLTLAIACSCSRSGYVDFAEEGAPTDHAWYGDAGPVEAQNTDGGGKDSGPTDLPLVDAIPDSRRDAHIDDSHIDDAFNNDAFNNDSHINDVFIQDSYALDNIVDDADASCTPPPGQDPPEIYQVVTTPDSDSSISVFWLSDDGYAAGYRIAWLQGSVPPADCVEGSVFFPTPVGTKSFQIAGLSPLTQYAVRLCAMDNCNNNSVASLVAIQSTLSSCDQTVSINETFTEFQARIDSGLDSNSDGRKTICIADGVEIASHIVDEGNALTLGSNADFTTICAQRGDNARIVNYRSDGTGFPAMSAVRVWGAEQVQLANLWLEAYGTDGECLDGQLSDGSAAITELSNIDCRINGNSAHGFDFTSRPVGEMKDVRFQVHGTESVAVVFSGTMLVGDMARISVEHFSACSNAGCAFDFDTGVDISRLRWITVTGNFSSGYVWDFDGTTIEEISDIDYAGSRPAFRINASTVYQLRRADIVSGSGDVMLIRNDSTLQSIVDSRLGIDGTAGAVLRLQTFSSIDDMHNTQLQKVSSAGAPNATAVIISDDSWVVSEQLSDLAICTETGAGQAWEDHSDGAAHGFFENASAVPPVVHVPYVSGAVTGAQTFPFDVLDGSGLQGGAVASQNIVLGGVCQ